MSVRSGGGRQSAARRPGFPPAKVTRRAAVATLLAGGGACVLGYAAHGVLRWLAPTVAHADHGGMGVDATDMSRYREMFTRHNEISRTVDDIPGGLRTTTQSSAPDLVAQLQAHVVSMYAHLDQGAEVMCMSASLPTLFRHASGYRRKLTMTPTGVITEETADDPALVDAIRGHAQEVTGFVRDGMPPMMRGMMDPRMMGPGMMGPGMMGPH